MRLTRDAGTIWGDVTPKAVPVRAKIGTIDVSAIDVGTAHIAVDDHRRQDDFSPRAWRTRDYGRNWVSIAGELPPGQFVGVLRADPVRRIVRRFIWDLRAFRPRASRYDYSIAAVNGGNTPQTDRELREVRKQLDAARSEAP